MAPEIVKVSHLWFEVLSYTNTREWMRKITAYLKEEDNWGLIDTVMKEWKAQKSGKAAEVEAAATGREAADLPAEKSILKHHRLTGKWLKEAEKKNWIKTNYKVVSILLSIIFMTNQQAVENLNYTGNIWLYIMKKYTKVNYSILTTAFANYFR